MTKTTSHPTSSARSRMHSDMSVEPAVGKHDDCLTRSQAQQLVGPIKSRMGETRPSLCRVAERGTPRSRREMQRARPRSTRRTVARSMIWLASRNSDSANLSAIAVESVALTLDVRPQLGIGILDGVEARAKLALRSASRHPDVPRIVSGLESRRIRGDWAVRITVASLVPTAWAISRADIAPARGPLTIKNSATDRSIGLLRSVADLAAKVEDVVFSSIPEPICSKCYILRQRRIRI